MRIRAAAALLACFATPFAAPALAAQTASLDTQFQETVKPFIGKSR